jgi:hypothetical protein
VTRFNKYRSIWSFENLVMEERACLLRIGDGGFLQ